MHNTYKPTSAIVPFTGYALVAGALIWAAGGGILPLFAMLAAAYFSMRPLSVLDKGPRRRRR